MTNKNLKFAITSLTSLTILTGCTPTEQTFGEKLQMRGDNVHVLGEHWTEGEKMAKSGHDLVASGNQDINQSQAKVNEGRSKIAKGESLMRQGNNLKAEAEVSYKEKVRNPVGDN
jgi:hypothetical protein